MSPSTHDIAGLVARAEAGDSGAQLDLAFHFERARQSDEACKWIDAAANSGDAEARFQRSVWKLYGRNFTRNERSALGEIESLANDRISAAAPTFAAILHASGLGVRRDWAKATHWLAHGAIEDEPRALTQLSLLQPDTRGGQRRAGLLLGRACALGFAPALAAFGGGRAPLTPRQGRALIIEAAAAAQDPASWAPQSREIFLKRPRIEIFPYAAPALWRRYLMATAELMLDPARAKSSDPGRSTHAPTPEHRSVKIELWDSDLIFHAISARIAAASGEALDRQEASRIVRYGANEARRAHDEIIEPGLGEPGARIKTALIYLNDDYTGGATRFPDAALGHKGKAGDLLILHHVCANGKPDAASLYAGLAPVRGEKWMMSAPIRKNRQIAQI